MPATWTATSLIALTFGGFSAYDVAERPEAAPARAKETRAQPAHVTPRLVLGAGPLIPGQVAELGIHLNIEPGWHVYWDGQNDTGLPISAKFRLPAGFEAGPIRWPAPHRHLAAGGILDHIYEEHVTLIVPVRVPADANFGPATLGVDLDWLVCKRVCLPEDGQVDLVVMIGRAGDKPGPTSEAKLLDEARARLPKPLPEGSSAPSAAWKGDRLILTGRAGGRVEFYPGPSCSRVADLVESGVSEAGRLELGFESRPPLRAEGVLAVWPAGGGRAEYFAIDLAQPGAAAPEAK